MDDDFSNWGESEENELLIIQDNLFVLLKVVDSICQEVNSNNIESAASARFLRGEIYWVQNQFNLISASLTSLLNVFPDHPQALNVDHRMGEIEKQIRKVRQAVSGLTIAKNSDSNNFDRYLETLDSLSGILRMYMKDFHDILRLMGGRSVSGLI